MGEVYDNREGGFALGLNVRWQCILQEIEQFLREGSHYSLSTGILPSLGAIINHRVKLRSSIILPYIMLVQRMGDLSRYSGCLTPLPRLGFHILIIYAP